MDASVGDMLSRSVVLELRVVRRPCAPASLLLLRELEALPAFLVDLLACTLVDNSTAK